MGSNVFGTPISDEMLRAMPEYHNMDEITAGHRASVALEMKNAEGKDINARKFLESLETRFDCSVYTMCMIYNATGNQLILNDVHDYTGRICESPYPMILLNGQWGVFLHGMYGNGEHGSEASIVYKGGDYKWITSWSNRADANTNKVYAAIYNENATVNYDTLKNHLNGGKVISNGTREEAIMYASIGNVVKCALEAVLTLVE